MFAIEYGGDEELWRVEARCADGAASLTTLFFLIDLANAMKA